MARRVASAAYIGYGTIKLRPMIVPNAHCPLHAAFLARWAAADGQRKEDHVMQLVTTEADLRA